MLIVLGSLLVGGIAGSLLRLESRIEGLGGWLQRRLSGETGSAERARFVEGFVISSLVFCSGPLTILGSLNDGLGNGPDQILLKATLDGFAAIAFAASFGWGVAASARHRASPSRAASRWRAWRSATSCPTRTSPPSPRSVGCSWSGSPSGCSGSGRSRSPTCYPRCWSPRCWSSVAAALH